VPGGGRATELLGLPDREVAVLDRHGGERPAAVQRDHVPQHHVDRPAVADDVVLGEEQDVVVGGQLDQQRTQQRTGGQVERLDRRLVHQPLRGRLVGGRHDPQRHLDLGLDDHGRPAVGVGREAGAQRLVPGDQPRQRRAQRVDVKRAADPQWHGDVVRRLAGRDLVHEPDPLLCVGQRHHGVGRSWLDPVPRRGFRGTLA
jgi:hypothetical protein